MTGSQGLAWLGLWLLQERYSEAGAAAIVRQIAGGLAALHANKISHRDLKPENCLFLTPAEDSPLKLMDFGLSSVEGQTSPLVGLFGSIDYVSPESLSKRDSKAPGDMWSLGVILYILLCGYCDLFFFGTEGCCAVPVINTLKLECWGIHEPAERGRCRRSAVQLVLSKCTCQSMADHGP